MSDSDENFPLSPNDSQSPESRMRRALGLQGPSRAAPQQRADQARPRHRFVQDGGVPVVVLNSRGENDPTAPLKARIAELDAALEGERAAHGVTRRALHEAQSSVQALQTRIVHSELAHGEALATERRARKDAEDSLQAQLLSQAEQLMAHPSSSAPASAGPASQKRTARKVARVPRAAKVADAKPVKWWLPTFREKAR